MRKTLVLIIQFIVAIACYAQSDECAGATVITPVAFGTGCSSTVSGNTSAATASAFAPSCASGADDDVWYRFTANSASIVIRFSNVRNASTSANEILLFAVYESACPSSTASFYCSNTIFANGYRIIQGLTPGNDYYVRIWSASTTVRINFDLCVQNVTAAPANDDCAGAIAINTQPFGSSCTTPIAANTSGSTASTPASACVPADENDDIWYSFTANSSSIILRFSNAIHTIDGSTGSLGYALYAGNCPGTAVSCDNFIGFGSGYQIIDGLVAGNIYRIKLFSTNANNFMSFNFCIQDVPAPPANDECSNAIPIATQPFSNNCTLPMTGNTTGATASAQAPSCATADNNDDIWYSFTANSTSVILRFNNVVHTIDGSTSSFGYALYNATCPSSTAAQLCAAFIGFGGGYRIIDGLVPGNTYLLRLFSTGSNNYISFNFCVQDVPSAPANNECSNAIAITTQPFGEACASSTAANTTGATISAQVPSCATNDSNDDIWYSFVASSASVVLRFSNAIHTIDGSTGSLGYALYNTACPTSTASLSCANFIGFGSGYRIIDGLTPGNTYYLRLYSSSVNNYMSFEFCVQDVPAPPPNNECANAIAISTQPFGTSCAAGITANTTGATMSSPASSCTSTDNNDDIWYSFVANSASVVLRFANAIDPMTNTSGNPGYALYNGSCPAATSNLACNNNIGFNNGYEIIDGLTPGNTYYLRLFSTGANNYLSFTFCVQDVPAPPANNECINATPVALVPWNGNCFTNSANTTGATRSANSPSCASGLIDNDDIWYQFIATGPTAVFRFNNVVTTVAGGATGIGYALYNNCPAGAASLACDDFIAQGTGSVLLSGLTPGNTYYLRLFGGFRNDYVSFNFCLQEPIPNDECSGALNLAVSNGFCNTPLIASLGGSTTSPGFGVPSCQGISATNDVWFRTIIPSTGNLIIQTSAVDLSVHDLVMTAYTGACGSLTQIACDDNGNPETFPSANHSRIVLTGRPAGQVIYIRVTATISSLEDRFAICAWDETPAVLPAISPGGNCIAVPTKTINAVNGNIYMWVPLYDNSGNIIAEIYSDGHDLGTITPHLYVNTGAIRRSGGQYYLDRNISIQISQVLSGMVKVRYYILNNELQSLQAADAGVTGIGSLSVIKTPASCQPVLSGTPTILPATATGSYGSDHYLQSNNNSFSSFYFIRSNAVLPLKILSFEGSPATRGNALKWVVAKDMEINKLVVERSADGVLFTNITEQRRNDFTNAFNDNWEYKYIDNQFSSATNYYRIRMEDVNGRSLYSTVIRISQQGNPSIIKIYPNPANDQLRIELTGNNRDVGIISVVDINGRVMISQSVSSRQAYTIINVSSLAKGLYKIMIRNGDESRYGSFIKQ